MRGQLVVMLSGPGKTYCFRLEPRKAPQREKEAIVHVKYGKVRDGGIHHARRQGIRIDRMKVARSRDGVDVHQSICLQDSGITSILAFESAAHCFSVVFWLQSMTGLGFMPSEITEETKASVRCASLARSTYQRWYL